MYIKTNTTKEQFNEYGYVYLKNIISDSLCDKFTNIMLDLKQKNEHVKLYQKILESVSIAPSNFRGCSTL